jgi:hypothetical protein
MPEFVECTSLSISYDILGLATVNFTIVSDASDITPPDSIEAGGLTFTGYVTNMTIQPIPETNWYEAQITMITTTD